MSDVTVAPAGAAQIEALCRIADATLFPGEMLPEMIAPALAGSEDEIWLTAQVDDTPIGFAFARRAEMADRVWNMLALGVDPARQRGGAGRALTTALIARLRGLGARLLMVDTSSDPAQTAALAFYSALGFRQVARIPDYWAEDDDKITFALPL